MEETRDLHDSPDILDCDKPTKKCVLLSNREVQHLGLDALFSLLGNLRHSDCGFYSGGYEGIGNEGEGW